MLYTNLMRTVLYHGVYVAIPLNPYNMAQMLVIDKNGALWYFESDYVENVVRDNSSWYFGRGDGNCVCLGMVDLDGVDWKQSKMEITPDMFCPVISGRE